MARFEQKTWIDGDLINAFEFNRIEQGVADSNGDSSGAVETANTAASDAAEAKRLATIAEQNSVNAVNTANEASTVATNANNSIQNALAQVSAATTAATEAKDAADRAAEQAATTASNAAQQAIEAANGAAAQAIETASNAAATANAAAERAENAASSLTDTTLTVSGRAADSKVVGDRLNTKANAEDVPDRTDWGVFVTKIAMTASDELEHIFTVEGVTPAMVVVNSIIPDKMRKTDWTVTTGQNQITINGDVLLDGDVTLMLMETR